MVDYFLFKSILAGCDQVMVIPEKIKIEYTKKYPLSGYIIYLLVAADAHPHLLGTSPKVEPTFCHPPAEFGVTQAD